MSQESKGSGSCNDPEEWDPFTFAINGKGTTEQFLMAQRLGKVAYREWMAQREFYESCADARRIKPNPK